MPKRKPYKKRTAAEIQRDTKEALEMHYEGYSVREIGEHQERSPSSVFIDIKAAAAATKQANKDFIQEKLMESLEALELAEKEALEGWYQSLKDYEKQKFVDQAGGKGGGFTQNVKEVVGQYGDPRFLNIIVKVQAEKIKLFDSMNIKRTGSSVLQKMYEQIMSRGGKNASR